MAWLKRYNISVVADVRQTPISRKKGFSKNKLQGLLPEKQIEYINFKELGTSRKMRDSLKATGDYRVLFRQYGVLLSEKKEQLDKIKNLAYSGKNVMLLCFERNPETCHRKMIAEAIKKRAANGLKVGYIVRA